MLHYILFFVFVYQIFNLIIDVTITSSLGYYFWMYGGYSKPPIVDLKYFGQEPQVFDDDYSIKPFKIDIPESDLKNLKEKLANTRELFPPLTGVGFNYGSNSDYLKTFLEFWKTKYNWKEREPYLNLFPQFTTKIAGLNIHFLHVKPNKTLVKGKEVLPMLLIHGWPGYVRGLYHLIPLLTTPMESHDFVFEVIAPSIPGNGFSDAPKVAGLDAAQISIMFHHLMYRLGFDKYYIHASDMGAIIGQSQAILHKEWVLGYHSNVCIALTRLSLVFLYLSIRIPFLFLDEAKKHIYRDNLWNLQQEFGFFHYSATKPDTLGVAFSDSPAALAGLVLEKFSTWSNPKRRLHYDGVLKAFDENDLLDIIMIYWLTNSVTTSLRFWKETFKPGSDFISGEFMLREVMVPAGCVWFSHEIAYTPLWALEQAFPNLLTLNYLNEGGHFPAIEKPLRLSDDIWNFVEKAREVAEERTNQDDLSIRNEL
ncbi:juvenile hormone epoxide hydrolase 2 isoform X2 [Halyomorpha halys]|uniref:juvenile hormone epoxide hydrolase 2 isoform X2 n=1 Tax=Halyomorpha halys TaxID=286706 RepID=UPI0034D1CABD